MPTSIKSRELRILSIVEARTVTGPVKPLLLPLQSEAHFQFSRVLMTTRRTQASSDELYTAATSAGAGYVAIRERWPFDISVLPAMRKAIKDIQPAIIDTHDCKSHFLVWALMATGRELRQAKWIAFHHGYTRTSWKVMAYQQLDRLTLPFADRVVTLCKPFAELLAGRGVRRERISVISNALAPRAPPSQDEVTRTLTSLHTLPDECLIVAVGRLSPEKGHEDLILAFQRTVAESRRNQLRLVIVGDGPMKPRLLKLAEPLWDRITFTGHLQDPWPLYHAADIFVLPSHSEGSPLVLLEAMAAHLPIVATSVGGVPETVTHDESALLVPPRNPQALSDALTRLVDDQECRHRLASAASVALAQFSPTEYVRKLVSIYNSVLSGS
jgi:glycosyltransferase involved in cell wall biosynthesis